MAKKNVSVYLYYLLRHNPADAGLHMDVHGWVNVQELIDGINARGKYSISRARLEEIVAADEKGRYRFSDDGKKIKACQGHSLDWIELELAWCEPDRGDGASSLPALGLQFETVPSVSI